MKKVLTIALVLTMLLLTLAACTNGNDSQPQNDVNQQTRVQLPDWPHNPNAIEITDDMIVTPIHAMPSVISRLEHLIGRIVDGGFYSSYSGNWIDSPYSRFAFRGIVLSERVFREHDSIMEGSSLIVTATKLLITEMYYGDKSPGDTIEIEQLGGTLDGHTNFFDWRVEMPIGEEFLIFADRPINGNFYFPTVNEGAVFWIANPYTGGALSATSNASLMEAGEIISHPNMISTEGGEPSFTVTREALAYLAYRGGHEIGAPIPVDVMAQAQVVHEQVAAARAEREAEAMREQQVAE